MKMLAEFREWQRLNPEWSLICDIEDTDSLYVQWHELPKPERMSWIGKYGEGGRWAFEEFGNKRCKVERKFLNSCLELVDEWPEGEAMSVYKINKPISDPKHEDFAGWF